jgi:hypothetical protein
LFDVSLRSRTPGGVVELVELSELSELVELVELSELSELVELVELSGLVIVGVGITTSLIISPVLTFTARFILSLSIFGILIFLPLSSK